jgi:serine phosphatase RsbU (regulator of sigma subunit)
MLLMVADGLGHGILASEAAREAERVFASSRTSSPTPILQDSHDALKKTRGAAMAVASLNLENKLVSFAGVGNIGASLVRPSGLSRGMASHNGTLGHHLHRIQEFTFPWEVDSVLVMHSDGLKTSWDLKLYPGVWRKHPALIAGMLYRDFYRDRDDVTILVAKNQESASPACN